MEKLEIEKADEYIIGKDGEKIGIVLSNDHPKKVLERIRLLEEKVKTLEEKVNCSYKCQ